MELGFGSGFPQFVSFAQLRELDEVAQPLFPEEESLLHPRAVMSRRRDFQLGRAAARQALQALGRNPEPILVGPQREPLWPKGIVGSITHSAGFAMAAVSERRHTGGIGIDVEHLDRSFDELVDHIAFDEEQELLESLSAEQRRTYTLELFSAKESVFKAFYPRVGRMFGFEAARLRPRHDGGFEGRLVDGLDSEYPHDRSFGIGSQWQGDLLLTSVFL